MPDASESIRCSAIGCDERYPIKHENVGEVGYRNGKWLGWMYLDLNRPDLAAKPLPFCSVLCTQAWLIETTTANRPIRDIAPYLAQPVVDALSARRGRKVAP